MNVKNNGLLYVALILIIVNCQSPHPEQDNRMLIGDWAFISSDTTYTELYIEENQLMFYSEKNGYIGPFDYEVKTNNIFFNEINYFVKKIDNNQVLLSSDDYKILLMRIRVNDSIDENNINPFYLRRCNLLVNEGMISMQDAILYLNSIQVVQ